MGVTFCGYEKNFSRFVAAEATEQRKLSDNEQKGGFVAVDN
jgi:hypothetical protein